MAFDAIGLLVRATEMVDFAMCCDVRLGVEVEWACLIGRLPSDNERVGNGICKLSLIMGISKDLAAAAGNDRPRRRQKSCL
jgi:hypothetical protein